MLTAEARAKINLCLHITGRRDDGYHLIDSLCVFARAADRLTVVSDTVIGLDVTGVFAAGLSGAGDNLVMRAAQALAATLPSPQGARLRLEKKLPVASGIGGGSADAAATLRLLAELWQITPQQRTALPNIALALGADVPVCLTSRPARMRGVGEQIDAVELPPFGLLLTNPGVPVSTAAVFAERARTARGFSPALVPPAARPAADLATWLQHTRNDLQDAAISLCPPIADVLAALAKTPRCLAARMSGSGATCFGLYPDAAAAAAAAVHMRHPGWWSAAG